MRRLTLYSYRMPFEGLLTSVEAADRIGVGVRTVIRLANSGELQPKRKLPGGRGAFLFDPADVDRLAEERRQTPATRAIQVLALLDAAAALEDAQSTPGLRLTDRKAVVDWLRRRARNLRGESQ